MKYLYYKIKSVSDLELTLEYLREHCLITEREYLSWFDININNNNKEIKLQISSALNYRIKENRFMILLIKDLELSFLSYINDINAPSNEIQYIRHILTDHIFSKVDELLKIVERINNENLSNN